MKITVYSVVVTYKDYSQDLDDIYPNQESAIRHAEKLISNPSVIEAQVNKDSVTEEYGRRWVSTVYRVTKQALG